MDAGATTSPLLRLPDELLLAVFEHIAQDEHEKLQAPWRRAMPPPGYLLISKRLNRVLTPRWYRMIALPWVAGGDRPYSLLLSRPSITPLIHEPDIWFPLERVHTCLWTVSQLVALRRLVITIFDSRTEGTYDPDDESHSLAQVDESLAALFRKLPYLVDFAIDVDFESDVQISGLDLGLCLATAQIRRLEVPGSMFELPRLGNIKLQHLTLCGAVSRPIFPLSELETLSFTGSGSVTLTTMQPFFDQYATYAHETGASPRLSLLKVNDGYAKYYQFASTSVLDLVTFLEQLSSTNIPKLDLTVCVKLDMSTRTIPPLRNVKTLRLHLPVPVLETSGMVLIAELIRRFSSLTRLSLRLRTTVHEKNDDDDPQPIWTTTRFCRTFPGIPTLVKDLSDTTEITQFVFERSQGSFVWTRDNASRELESRQICD